MKKTIKSVKFIKKYMTSNGKTVKKKYNFSWKHQLAISDYMEYCNLDRKFNSDFGNLVLLDAPTLIITYVKLRYANGKCEKLSMNEFYKIYNNNSKRRIAEESINISF